MRRLALALVTSLVTALGGTPEVRAADDAGVSDPDNREKPPLASVDLTARASHLLDAVVRGEPAIADDFFFPREPFLALKDVSDPGRYHAQLLATYHRDVLELSRKRASWEGARFISFELGGAPAWVAPGKEYNKIGYYRTFHSRLRYALGDREHTLDVTTIISWGGSWYVTHLLPIKR